MPKFPTISLLESPNWTDYALLDSGDGLKLERFGPYTFVRPEVQAMWRRSLPDKEWAQAHAVFQPTREESGGHWQFKKKVEEKWEMAYSLTPGPSPKGRGENLRFWAMTTPGRHLGVFPGMRRTLGLGGRFDPKGQAANQGSEPVWIYRTGNPGCRRGWCAGHARGRFEKSCGLGA